MSTPNTSPPLDIDTSSNSSRRTFPRAYYNELNSMAYTWPKDVLSARILWAARAASAAWAAAAASGDEGTLVDLHTFRLAVLDKALELNEARWNTQKIRPKPSEWQRITSGFINDAFLLAKRQLALNCSRPAPSTDDVVPFCRTAMDWCADIILDRGPIEPARPELRDLGVYEKDSIEYAYGRLDYGGEYSPETLEPPYLAVGAKMAIDPKTGEYVFNGYLSDYELSSDQDEGYVMVESSPQRGRRCSSGSCGGGVVSTGAPATAPRPMGGHAYSRSPSSPTSSKESIDL